MNFGWIKQSIIILCVIMLGLCFGFFLSAIATLQILHLPTDTNEIVTVVCVLGKCMSLP